MSFFSWGGASFLVVTLLSLVPLLRRYLVMVTVENQSMAPTLEHGDRVIVLRAWPARWLRKRQIVLVWPTRVSSQEPILFRVTPYIKRIIAVGGETLAFAAERTTLTAQQSSPEALDQQGQQTCHVPQGSLFVCGDNRDQSIDSRTWGPLPIHCVLGIVCLKLPRKAQPAILSSSSQKPILAAQPLPSRQRAPSFSALSVGREVVTLDAYQGQMVLLLFIADTRVSRPLIPFWQDLALRLAAKNIATVFVCDSNEGRARVLVEHYAIAQPMLLAHRDHHTFLHDYHIQGTPAYCLIDALGNVQSSGYPNHSSLGWRELTGEATFASNSSNLQDT